MYGPIGAEYTISQAKKYPDDFSTIHYVVSRYGYALKYASSTLKDNYEIVITAVCCSGMSLEYASDRLKNNYTVVYKAVSNIGQALAHASPDLRNNHNIVMMAVSRSSGALIYASEELKHDPVIILNSICKHYSSYAYASDELKSDKPFIREAYSVDACILEYVSKDVLHDLPFMIELTDYINRYPIDHYDVNRLAYTLRYTPVNVAGYILLLHSTIPNIKQSIIRTNIGCNLTDIIKESILIQDAREAYRKKIITDILGDKVLMDIALLIADFTVDIHDIIQSKSLFEYN